MRVIARQLTMRVHSIASICVLSAVAICAQVAGTHYDATVDRRYEGPNGQVIEGLGGCSYTTDQVSCYDMDGKPSRPLSDRVTSALTSSNSELYFRFGRKNRLLLFREISNPYGFQVSGENSNSFQQMGSFGAPDNLAWGRYIAEPNEKTASLVFSEYLPSLRATPDLAFGVGATSTVQGVRYEIGHWEKTKLGGSRQAQMYMGDSSSASLWNVTVVIGEGNMVSSPNFLAFDKAGREIQYVDQKGDPVPSAKVLEEQRQNPNEIYNSGAVRKYVQAVFNLNGGQAIGNAHTAITNVNPDRIGSLQLMIPQFRRILLKGFPLDPNP